MTARGRCNVLVKLGYEDITPLKLWKDPFLSKDSCNIKNTGTYFVITRDGARLATEVWPPNPTDASKEYPAELIRTPYHRLSNTEFWHRFVRRGYALVIQDVRGRDDSDGEWVPYKYDREEVLSIRPIKDILLKNLRRNIHFWDEDMTHPDNDEH